MQRDEHVRPHALGRLRVELRSPSSPLIAAPSARRARARRARRSRIRASARRRSGARARRPRRSPPALGRLAVERLVGGERSTLRSTAAMRSEPPVRRVARQQRVELLAVGDDAVHQLLRERARRRPADRSARRRPRTPPRRAASSARPRRSRARGDVERVEHLQRGLARAVARLRRARSCARLPAALDGAHAAAPSRSRRARPPRPCCPPRRRRARAPARCRRW